MGAWGTSLYDNDTMKDVQGMYVDALKRGKTNIEATQMILDTYRDLLDDADEGALLWFALADTQWEYGRLLPCVKDKALFFLQQEGELERWKESGEKNYTAWLETRKTLEEKLLKPQPNEKRVSKYRLFTCPWEIGDLYAYQFFTEYSREKNLHGMYVVFKKISTKNVWPGHIIPIVQIYNWIGAELIPLGELKKRGFIVQNYLPDWKPRDKEYFIGLFAENKKQIPTNQLTFIQNDWNDELKQFERRCWDQTEHIAWDTHKGHYGWKKFEEFIIDQHLAWNEAM